MAGTSGPPSGPEGLRSLPGQGRIETSAALPAFGESMNLAALVAHHARYRGARTAVEARDFTATYAEFHVLARRIAARLRAAGVGPGDLVGVRMRDTPLHLAALIGIFHLGGVVLPLDWRAAGAEVERIVASFPPKAVVADVTRGLPDGVNLVGLDAIEETAPDGAPAVALTDHPAVYSLTSGTTGEPKAIVLTHEQFFGRATMALCSSRLTLPDDRFLPLLPLAYSNGRVIYFALLAIGATVMMFPTLFEPRELVDFVNGRNVTAMMVSPNVVRQLLAMEAGRRASDAGPARLRLRRRQAPAGGAGGDQGAHRAVRHRLLRQHRRRPDRHHRARRGRRRADRDGPADDHHERGDRRRRRVRCCRPAPSAASASAGPASPPRSPVRSRRATRASATAGTIPAISAASTRRASSTSTAAPRS